MRLQDYDIATQYTGTIADTHPITPPESDIEVREITLDVFDDGFNVQVGQNIGILLPGHESFGNDHHLRLYSVADVPEKIENALRVHICVRRCNYIDEFTGEEHPGLASNYLCDLRHGETLTLTGPYGSPFQIPTESNTALILIGAGTGIAPFRAMIKQAFRRQPPFAGRIYLFHGAQTGLEMLYRNDQKDDFAQYYDLDTFEAIGVLSNRPHWSTAIDWESAFSSRAEELWAMLLDSHTYVYIAGLEGIRDELEREFAKLADSEDEWTRRKAELVAGKRWNELLY